MDNQNYWNLVISLGVMIAGQLFIQTIAWVKFTASIGTRVAIIERDITNVTKEVERHIVTDEAHHKASWEKIAAHTIKLAQLNNLK